MKKGILILLVSLLWCNVSVAKEIWLECIFNPGKGHSGFVNSFIIDEANQTLIMNGVKQFVVEFDHTLSISILSHLTKNISRILSNKCDQSESTKGAKNIILIYIKI